MLRKLHGLSPITCISVLLLGLSPFVSASLSHAQGFGQGPGQVDRGAVQQFFARLLEIEESSPLEERLTRFLDAIEAGRSPLESEKSRESKRPMHHWKLRDGHPFPNPEELEAAGREQLVRQAQGNQTPPSQNPAPADLQAFSGNGANSASKMIQDFLLARELPKCDFSRTLKQKRRSPSASFLSTSTKKGKKGSQKDGREVIYDLLILPESLAQDPEKSILPPNYSEIFGEGVRVHYYSAKAGDLISYHASRQGVSCLPYRLRVTQDFQYTAFGKDALENFSGGKKRWKGTFHPWLASRLGELLP
jgi:hypothetical protein